MYPKTPGGAELLIDKIFKTEKVDGSGIMGNPLDAYNAALALHGDEKFAIAVEYMASKGDSGLPALEKEIAGLAVEGLNVNQIITELKQGKYRNDPSFDVMSISSTVSRVLSELTPEARQKRVDSKARAAKLVQQRVTMAENLNKRPPGLMTRP